MDSPELLQRYAEEHSEAAFTELVRRHVDLVYSAALRQVGGDAHRAQDVTQIVFTELARSAAKLSRHTALTGWLYTTTHFTAGKILRTERRRCDREKEAQLMNELLGSRPDDNWECLRPVLDEAMHKLNRRDREAILLRFFEQRSFAEVGKHLGLGENAARMNVERALDKLGGLLAQRGVRSTAGALAVVLANQTVSAAPVGLVSTVAGGALAQIAVASASSGAASVLVNFMSTAKIAAIAAAGLVALGTGLFYQAQASRTEKSIADMNRESEQLRARLLGMSERIASVETSALQPAHDAQSSGVAAGGLTPESTAHAAAVAREAVTRELLSNGRFNQLTLQNALADIRSGRGLFYQRLGLTLEQIKQFEAILSGALSDAWKVRVDAQLASRNDDDPATRASLQQVRQRMEDSIRGLLGESGLAHFLDHERAQKAEGFAQLMALNLYFTDSPVTPEQGRQIAEILTRHSPDFQQGRDFNFTQLDNDKVLADATSVLLPSQVESLRDLLEYYAFQRELNAARRAAAGGKAR